MDNKHTIKIYLNKEVHRVNEKGTVVAVGNISPAGELVQLDAFLTGVRNALIGQPDAASTLVNAIEKLASQVTAKGNLLTLNIASTLDPKNHSMSYSFELKTE